MDGRIECLYHGWQFEGDGKCVKIPQVCTLSCLSLTSTKDMHFVHQNHVRMRLDLTLTVKSRIRLGQLLVDVGDFHHLLVEIPFDLC